MLAEVRKMRSFPLSSVLLLFVVRVCLACDDAHCVWGFCVTRGTGSSECVCLEGYEGENCDTPSLRLTRDADSGSSLICPCENGGSCLYEEDMAGESSCEVNCLYSCACPPGFTGDLCTEKSGII